MKVWFVKHALRKDPKRFRIRTYVHESDARKVMIWALREGLVSWIEEKELGHDEKDAQRLIRQYNMNLTDDEDMDI